MTAALLAAIGDRRGRDRRRAIGLDLLDWWRGRPALAEARLRLDAIAPDDADAALAAMHPALAEPGWLREGLATLAAAMCADPLLEPPLQPVWQGRGIGLQLFRHARASLLVTVHRPPPAVNQGVRTITFPGRGSLMRVVAGAGELDRWSIDDEGRCRCIGRAPIDAAAIHRFDGARESWSLRAAGEVVVIQAVAAAAGNTTLRTHDVATGTLLAERATDGAAMRLQLMATLLRRMARHDAADALADAAREGPPHQRWHLARELAALDRAAARPLIEELAARDPDREVREAARRTIPLLAA